MRLIITVILVFFTIKIQLNAQQIVNIESQRLIEEKEGFSGSLDLNLKYTRNQSRILQFNNKAQVQYRINKSLLLFINDINIINANEENLINNNYQHLRYNYKINDLITWELFVQRQTDLIYRLQLRGLAGTGPRIRILDRDSISIYFGSLYMYEYEQIVEEDIHNTYHRKSSYLSLIYDYRDFYQFRLIAYYQPEIINFGDYRISAEIINFFKLTDRLSFSITYSLRYDSAPPEGVTDTFLSISNALRIVF